jgi:hypothetical protein
MLLLLILKYIEVLIKKVILIYKILNINMFRQAFASFGAQKGTFWGEIPDLR